MPSSVWNRLLLRIARLWDSLELLFRRAERETREVEAEVRQLGLDLLDKVDDLPFVPQLVPMPPLTNQYYGHGAFMGAAPALLHDERWRRILAFLMPDVFWEVQEVLKERPEPGVLIPMFENNPVMCAYGVWYGSQRRKGRTDLHPNDLAGVEWDIFVEDAQITVFEEKVLEKEDAQDLIRTVVDRMVIAHASTADTVQEAAGVCQYEDVRRTPKTRMGGVQADAWLDLFGRALRLAEAPDLMALMADYAKLPRYSEQEACMNHCFRDPMPVELALEPYRRMTGRAYFSIVLEIKSRRSTPAFLGAMVRELNRRGLHVAAVCSFDPSEVAGLSSVPQQVGTALLLGPREIRFFHWAGEVQAACDRGEVAVGQSLLFNGASLLSLGQEKDAPYLWDREVIEELDSYRRNFGLHIGLYVQEGDCDHAAVMLLTELVRRYPATFELGFAWGGLLDEVTIPHDGRDRRGLGSQALMRWVGEGPWKLRRGEGVSEAGDAE